MSAWAYGTYANIVRCGTFWALCFYHFRCTMPKPPRVPAAAPFTSVSACLTTFMELILPDLAHRHRHSHSHSHRHLLALYSLFNQWLSAFHRGLETCSRKWQIARPTLPGCCCFCCCESVPRLCLLCPLIHSEPCHSFAQRCLSCLRALPAFCSCTLRLAGTARNFLHMFTAWIFYGFKCFQLESFALRLAPCRSTRTHINSLD